MEITLKAGSYTALFLPEKGMTLASFKKDGTEVIDQETKATFEERRAGLGPLIGPHFHMRSPARIPKLTNESAFPQIQQARDKGRIDPFSHGIAKFVPWKFEATGTTIKGTLSGKETWNDVPLSVLEGQNFIMSFEASLSEEGLNITLSVVSDTDSVVGLHTYYRLPDRKGRVKAFVNDKARINQQLVDVPASWGFNSENELLFELDKPADFTFTHFPSPLEGKILLETSEYTLSIISRSMNQENSWQLFHPPGASYVCIEPLSASNPKNPILSASTLHVQLQIKL